MNPPTQFPASLELFHLVRRIADQNEESMRISDVDIGRAVGFESARTSRWKHGQIAVTDAARLLSLAQAFDINLTVLIHVAAGYLSADEALKVLEDESKLVRFLGEQLLLSKDHQALTLTSGDGMFFRVIRRSVGHYHRRVKRIGHPDGDRDREEPTVLLADDDKSAIEAFANLTGANTGIQGVVARSGPEALVIAGRTQPQLIIFDMFLGQIDGFSALRTLASDAATQEALLVATSLSLTPEITRQALGCGAIEVVPRPLRSRVLSRLLARVRRSR